VCHIGTCLDASGSANEQGYHAVAICLTRQCVEALTIVEAAFLEPPHPERLLSKWLKGSPQGNLRKEIERLAWPNYGKGLWDEPWSEYFANLAKAVQPYSHYTPELLQWQLAVMSNSDGKSFIAGAGPGTFDPLKGHRVSLLHVLIIWSLGRILFENRPDVKGLISYQDVDDLGQSLANSNLLIPGSEWAIQLWPHMFLKKNQE
jgi:hypothetical protein